MSTAPGSPGYRRADGDRSIILACYRGNAVTMLARVVKPCRVQNSALPLPHLRLHADRSKPDNLASTWLTSIRMHGISEDAMTASSST